jgi:hypothetical protein
MTYRPIKNLITAIISWVKGDEWSVSEQGNVAIIIIMIWCFCCCLLVVYFLHGHGPCSYYISIMGTIYSEKNVWLTLWTLKLLNYDRRKYSFALFSICYEIILWFFYKILKSIYKLRENHTQNPCPFHCCC